MQIFVASDADFCNIAAVTESDTNHKPTKTMTAKQKASAAYLEAYNRAMKALNDVENMIHDNPAPEGETEIHWGHVGDMLRIAAGIEELLPED